MPFLTKGPNGLLYRSADLYHLQCLIVDMAKGHPTRPKLPVSILRIGVLPFLVSKLQRPVAAGRHHTCAVTQDGQLHCFGDNFHGQCDVPTNVGPIAAVAAGQFHTCAVAQDGQLHCFGDNSAGQCDEPRNLGPIAALAVGADHTCAVTQNGQLHCFGDNSAGQCDVPRNLGPIAAVAAGRYHCYAGRLARPCARYLVPPSLVLCS